MSLITDFIRELSIKKYCRFKSRPFFYGFLSNLKNLVKLSVENNTKQIISIIDALLMSKCESIFDLQLNFDKFYNFDNLALFLTKQKKLRVLKLLNIILDEKLMKSIEVEFLEELHLKIWNAYSCLSVLNLLYRFKKLQVFSFHGIDDVKDFEALVEPINKNVKLIEIAYNNDMSLDEPMRSFSRLQSLETFKLYGDVRIGPIMDNVITSLSLCKNLKKLNLNFKL